MKILLNEDLWRYGCEDLIKKIFASVADDILMPSGRAKEKNTIIDCAISSSLYEKEKMVLEELIKRKIDLKIDFLNSKKSYSLFSYLIVHRRLEGIALFIEALSHDTAYLREEVSKIEKDTLIIDDKLLKAITQTIEEREIKNQKALLDKNIVNLASVNYIVKL